MHTDPNLFYKERNKHDKRIIKFMTLSAIMAGAAASLFVGANDLHENLSPELYSWVIPSIEFFTIAGYAGLCGALASTVIRDNTDSREDRPFRVRLLEKVGIYRQEEALGLQAQDGQESVPNANTKKMGMNI